MRRVNKASDRPAYKQLADIIRDLIMRGELPPGVELPSEAELMEQQEVSRNTVIQAIALLRNEGLLVSTRGKRTRVRPIRVIGAQRYTAGKAGYEPDVEGRFAQEHGVGWSEFDTTREYRVVAASARVAAALMVPTGADVYERRWTHSTGGVPLRVSWSYLDASRFADTVLVDPDEPPWPGGTISQLHSVGIDVTLVRTEVTARAATANEAQALNLDPGAAVLEAWRVQFAERQPVEAAQHVYPAGGQILVFDTPIAPGVTPLLEGLPPD